MFSYTNHHNSDIAVIKLLRNLSINIDPTAICAELEKHPDYPSLLAISDLLGNVEANNIITMVTSPYCQPCAKTRQSMDKLLEQNGDILARIVFTADNTDNDIKTPISRHLMALNNQPDKTIVTQALYD